MAGTRIDIMELRQIIALKNKGLSNRKAADLLGVSRNTVNAYVRLFESYQLNYGELLELDDASLMELFPATSEIDSHRYKQLSGYFEYFQSELKKPGCTIDALWKAYLKKHPDGYRHSQFSHHFNQWREKFQASGKLHHKAGEKIFVDFTGKKLQLADKSTGELQAVNVFVAIFPCSQYTFVRAVPTQSMEDFIAVMVQCLEYFDGVPLAIIADNLKAAVRKSCRYSPRINRTFQDFAMHYGCVIDPTRPYSAKDKAMVEGAVKLVYQRIFYPLSEQTFFNLRDLNEQIRILLDQYNDYKFSLRPTTRRQEFISLEKPHLQPLPPQPYLIRKFKRLKVQKMGYIYLSDDKHYYSVPYRYIGKQTEVRYSYNSVEIYYEKQRIAIHPRDKRPGKYSTNQDHLSSAHRAYSQWNPEFFRQKAQRIGPCTTQYISNLIDQRPYPEVAYKQAQGILMLANRFTAARVEKSCQRALLTDRFSYHTIENILKMGLDAEDLQATSQTRIPFHDNIRGAENYQ